MTNLLKRLANLMSVKSLVTISLTIVFCIMAYKQTISQDFMTIYSVVIAFFFGAQSTKSNNQELQNDLEYAETKNAELYNQLMELSKENAALTAKLKEVYNDASNPELPDE